MPKPVTDARTRIAEIAVEITALRDELRRLAASVPGDEDVFDLLFESARRLSAIQFQLRGIAESLSTLAEETEDEDSLLRSAIECIIADSLEPAISNLERAAQPRRRAAKP